MKISWQGVSGVDETGGALLTVTMRQEYSLIIKKETVLTFLQTLEQLLESNTISPEVAIEWKMQFSSIYAMFDRLDGVQTRLGGISLVTPWQDLPASDFLIILKELEKIFASGITFSITGTAPNYSVEYRFGTYILSRAIDASSLPTILQITEKLKAATKAEVNDVLDKIKTNALRPIEGLNLLAGGVNLAGGPLGGLAIALAVDAARPQTMIENPVLVGRVLVIALIPVVTEGMKKIAETYETYQKAEKLKAEKKLLDYELERKKQEQQEREKCFPIKDSGQLLAGEPRAVGREIRDC